MRKFILSLILLIAGSLCFAEIIKLDKPDFEDFQLIKDLNDENFRVDYIYVISGENDLGKVITKKSWEWTKIDTRPSDDYCEETQYIVFVTWNKKYEDYCAFILKYNGYLMTIYMSEL